MQTHTAHARPCKHLPPLTHIQRTLRALNEHAASTPAPTHTKQNKTTTHYLCMLVCLRARTHTPHAPLPGLQAPLPPPPTTPTHTQTFTHRSGQAPATWRRAAEDVVVGVCAQHARVALLCVACVAAHARLWAATSHDVKWAKCPVCGMSGRMMHVMHAHHACLSH